MKVTLRRCVVALVSILLVAIGMSGCGSGPTEVVRGVNVGSATRPTEVASVSIADAKVTFYSVTRDGITNIAMSETGSAFAKHNIVAPLLAQKLTTQEIYLALAPQGATAPARLVAAHAEEAANMGRTAEVRKVAVDTAALTEKSLTSCESAIFGQSTPDSGCRWENFNSGYINGGCAADNQPTNWCHYTPNWIIAGACNESTSVTVSLYLAWQYATSPCNGSFNGYDHEDMAPYTYYYWYYETTGSGAFYEVLSTDYDSNCSQQQFDAVQGFENCG
jgi:hypothetical protein